MSRRGHPWTLDRIRAGEHPWRWCVGRGRRRGGCGVGMQDGADVLDSLELRVSRDVGTLVVYERSEGMNGMKELVIGGGVRYGEGVVPKLDGVTDGGAPCVSVEDGVAAVVVEGRANVITILAVIIPRTSDGGLHMGEGTTSERCHGCGIEVKGAMQRRPG